MAKECYANLLSFCQVLEAEGYWKDTEKYLNKSIYEMIDMYLQSILLILCVYCGENGLVQRRFMLELVSQNELQCPDEGDLPEDAEVYIHNTVTSATADLSVGIVTRDSHGTPETIRAKYLGNHRYAAIIVPQRLNNRQPLVEVVMKGVSYLYESKFLFKSGVQHNVLLAVSKNPEQVKIEVGGEWENWD